MENLKDDSKVKDFVNTFLKELINSFSAEEQNYVIKRIIDEVAKATDIEIGETKKKLEMLESTKDKLYNIVHKERRLNKEEELEWLDENQIKK